VPATKPPFRPDVPCDTQTPPNLAAGATPPPAQTRAKPRYATTGAVKKLLDKAMRQLKAERKAAK
jgi:hypothetical protein